MHPSGRAGVPLDELRPCPPTRVGGRGGFVPNAHKEQEQKPEPKRATVRTIRASVGPKKQARATLEQSVLAGTGGGVGGGPVVLLRAVDRKRWGTVPVHGRWVGGHSDGAPDVRRRGAPLPPVAAV